MLQLPFVWVQVRFFSALLVVSSLPSGQDDTDVI